MWDERYATEAYVYGEAPNAFLASCLERLRPGDRALAVADGEGRNGVWLAEQGLDVVSVDASAVGLEKARRLAGKRGVFPEFIQADLFAWDWPEAAFDVVAAIFIQFAGPGDRPRLFESMKRSLKPGGALILQGYRPEQVALGTGGPPAPENMYTETMLRDAFADFEIAHLRAHDDVIEEGAGHSGLSALIDLVALKPDA
ncbi:SAM-dependent methyltransferase [Marinicauda salina]|uniref:SAM-dependent methyltransferase n=1 Tax=Marinicauda salina TaxID=2135793 RepID=A0A2U2BTV0_9PROT|nr:class I SAM-dependent methyltransferase [Marinicauda salina]PWE17410.1 SAM-dependent methyltransferase [Marinicauda salina]